MNVDVRYLAQLRQLAGRSTEQLDLPSPCDVSGLIRQLADRHERLRRVLLDDAAQVQPTILVFINDEQVDRTRALQDGDEVTLMTPIAGGAA